MRRITSAAIAASATLPFSIFDFRFNAICLVSRLTPHASIVIRHVYLPHERLSPCIFTLCRVDAERNLHRVGTEGADCQRLDVIESSTAEGAQAPVVVGLPDDLAGRQH